MSNYSNTKATIAANVYTNHNNEVTAEMVKTGINAVVDTLIAGGFLYKGVATTSTNPGSPDANVFYIATAPGTYTNFGSLVVADGEVAILKYNGSWSKEVTGAATAAEVSALGHKVDKEIYNVSQQNSGTDYTSRSAARGAVPSALRAKGTILTYSLNGEWVVEQFIGANPGYGWQSLDYQWRDINSITETINLRVEWQPGQLSIGSGTPRPISVSLGSVPQASYHSGFYDIENAISLSASSIPTGASLRCRWFDANMNYLGVVYLSSEASPAAGTKYCVFDILKASAISTTDLYAITISVKQDTRCKVIGMIKFPYKSGSDIGTYKVFTFSFREVYGGNKNVEGTNVSTIEKASDNYLVSQGCVMLPDTYSHNGTPTKVIWFCNGSGNPQAAATWGGYLDYVNYLLSEGYAVIDCACWGGVPGSLGNLFYNFWATPTNVAVTNAFYDFVMRNFNFEKDFCVASKSQGGVKAFYIANSPLPVKAACFLASRVSPLCGIYGYSDKERATSLIDMGFTIEQDASGNITNPACMSHNYGADNMEDATRRAYWESQIELIEGTDPLFSKDIGAEYLSAYRYVSGRNLANYLAQNPKIMHDVPMLFIGAEDDGVYGESLFAFNAMQNQLSYARRINMPNGATDPHHAVDTDGPFVNVTTRFGESKNVPLAWAEMLAFFDNKA